MRPWLKPRCVLVVVLLVVAPGAALAHLFTAWLPGEIALRGVRQALARDSETVARETAAAAELWQKLEAPSGKAGAERCVSWLPGRQRNEVFERIAAALRQPEVTIEELTLGQVGVYAAVSPAALLACERVNVRCQGDYAGLTVCLDRLAELKLPVCVTELRWERHGKRLELWMQLAVPFEPDEELAGELAKAHGLIRKDAS